jgi:hypothetical protein
VCGNAALVAPQPGKRRCVCAVLNITETNRMHVVLIWHAKQDIWADRGRGFRGAEQERALCQTGRMDRRAAKAD